jgi:hypothetical protein
MTIREYLARRSRRIAFALITAETVFAITVGMAAHLGQAAERIVVFVGFFVAFLIYMALVRRIKCPRCHVVIGAPTAYRLVSATQGPKGCPHCQVGFDEPL